MQLRLALLPLLLAGAAMAQQSLPLLSTGGQYIWVPPPTSCGFFFDITINTTVTFQGVTFPTYTPVGSAAGMQMWITNPGLTTHVGNEAIPANWTMVGSGSWTVPAAPTSPSVCFTSGATLQPGTYGCVLMAQNCNNIFANNATATTPATTQIFSNADMTVTLGATGWGGFVSPLSLYVFIGTLFYAQGAVPHTCASKSTYGAGCNTVSGSFYQYWTNNASMATDLNGRKLSLLFNGVDYTLIQGTVSYIPPTAAATALPANSNGESTVALPSAFSYPGGSTTQFVIATDGHVAPLSNLPFPGANYTFMPYAQGFLDSANPSWAVCWHNFNTTELNSGLIKWELVGNLFVVTWDNVESLPGNTATQNPNPCTFQAQFDLSNGNVHYVYQSMTTIGGSQSYDHTLVGYSPGGVSPDGGPINVTTLTALPLPPVEVQPLKLTASAAPVLGGSVDLTTSNEPGLNLGVNFLSLAAIPSPGIPLAVLGAPGCFAHIDLNTSVGNTISNLGTPFPGMTATLPIPLSSALSGFLLTSQSAWLAPGANAFGIITSNGVSLTLGLFAL